VKDTTFIIAGENRKYIVLEFERLYPIILLTAGLQER
jgi:hypothetical protein